MNTAQPQLEEVLVLKWWRVVNESKLGKDYSTFRIATEMLVVRPCGLSVLGAVRVEDAISSGHFFIIVLCKGNKAI